MEKCMIGIIGTGMMASSLTVLTSGHGFKTLVLARSESSRERCMNAVDGYYRQMVDQGIITPEQVEICKSYISYTSDYGEMSRCRVFFECVTEKIEAKEEVYKAIEKSCPEAKAICSVSSSIVPGKLAEVAGKYADRVLVTHPFNPPHLVPYFEICTAECTKPDVLPFVKELLAALDRKTAILKKPTPGFIGNRLQFALWRECLALVEEGICDPEDVDTALAYSFCPRYTSIGIFQHFDNGGLELNATTCKATWPIISDKKDIPDFMKKLMAEGKMGAKSPSRQGFYDWNGVDMEAYSAKVSEPYWRFCKWEFPTEASSDDI
ncbi:MAG: 3-hydroxyacyl-CoA dehydrogenase family protein [Lachnospiraceae bacterium]|nr:3-hydroxyacyl-CoA dehydrogenase family protein [Lachnospiraceae bacterium]